MSTFYFVEKLGNAYELGIGRFSIGKIWFGTEDESQSPMDEKEAELVANKIIAYLNKEHPVTDEMAEKFGDSEDTIEMIQFKNKLSEGISCDDDGCDSDMSSLAKLALLGSMLGD